MLFIFDSLKFLLFLAVAVYIPGKFLIERAKVDLDQVQNISASLVSGIIIFCLVSIAMRLFGLSFALVLTAFVIFDLWALLYKKVPLKVELNKNVLLLFFVATTFAIFSGLNLFKSGSVTKNGILMSVGVHDPLQHLAIIGQLQRGFPPKNPFFSGENLNNYHYYADILIAGVVDSVQLDKLNFYFKIFPFFNAMLFAFSCYSLMSVLTKKMAIKFLGLLLCAFGGTAAYLLIFLLPSVQWSGGTFWVDQPFAQLFNPQTYIGYSLFFIGSMLLIKSGKSQSLLPLVFAGVLLGFIFPFKVFGAVICVGALLTVAVYMGVFQKDFKYFVPFIISVAVFGILTLFTVNSYRNGLYFVPGWSLSVIVESPDRLNLVDWSLKLQFYKQDQNILRIVQIYTQEVFIYLFGNLGIRALGLFFIAFVVLKNLIKLKVEQLFFFSCIVISFTIPLLFNQGSSPYDIFQFVPYGLIVCAIFTALAVEYSIKKFKLNNLLIILIILVVFGLSLPTTILDIRGRIKNDRFTIGQEHLDALKFIAEKSDINDAILIYPDKDNINAAYVPAFSQRVSYVSDLGSTNITAVDGKSRADTALLFFNTYSDDERSKFLSEYNIKLVILPVNVDSELKSRKRDILLERVFENGKYVVYRGN